MDSREFLTLCEKETKQHPSSDFISIANNLIEKHNVTKITPLVKTNKTINEKKFEGLISIYARSTAIIDEKTPIFLEKMLKMGDIVSANTLHLLSIKIKNLNEEKQKKLFKKINTIIIKYCNFTKSEISVSSSLYFYDSSPLHFYSYMSLFNNKKDLFTFLNQKFKPPFKNDLILKLIQYDHLNFSKNKVRECNDNLTSGEPLFFSLILNLSMNINMDNSKSTIDKESKMLSFFKNNEIDYKKKDRNGKTIIQRIEENLKKIPNINSEYRNAVEKFYNKIKEFCEIEQLSIQAKSEFNL